MTFIDLQKLVQSQSQTTASGITNLQAKLQGKPFWIFDQQQHKQEDIKTKGQCCFWHIIGLPQKDSHDMPLLPYQRTLYETLQNHNTSG